MASCCCVDTYYIDYVYGDDTDTGLTRGTAWKTLSKASGSDVKDGDCVVVLDYTGAPAAAAITFAQNITFCWAADPYTKPDDNLDFLIFTGDVTLSCLKVSNADATKAAVKVTGNALLEFCDIGRLEIDGEDFIIKDSDIDTIFGSAFTSLFHIINTRISNWSISPTSTDMLIENSYIGTGAVTLSTVVNLIINKSIIVGATNITGTTSLIISDSVFHSSLTGGADTDATITNTDIRGAVNTSLKKFNVHDCTFGSNFTVDGEDINLDNCIIEGNMVLSANANADIIANTTIRGTITLNASAGSLTGNVFSNVIHQGLTDNSGNTNNKFDYGVRNAGKKVREEVIMFEGYTFGGKDIYVDQENGGTANGETEATAFTTIVAATAVANPGDKIWVIVSDVGGGTAPVAYAENVGVPKGVALIGMAGYATQDDTKQSHVVISGAAGSSTPVLEVNEGAVVVHVKVQSAETKSVGLISIHSSAMLYKCVLADVSNATDDYIDIDGYGAKLEECHLNGTNIDAAKNLVNCTGTKVIMKDCYCEGADGNYIHVEGSTSSTILIKLCSFADVKTGKYAVNIEASADRCYLLNNFWSKDSTGAGGSFVADADGEALIDGVWESNLSKWKNYAGFSDAQSQFAGTQLKTTRQGVTNEDTTKTGTRKLKDDSNADMVSWTVLDDDDVQVADTPSGVPVQRTSPSFP